MSTVCATDYSASGARSETTLRVLIAYFAMFPRVAPLGDALVRNTDEPLGHAPQTDELVVFDPAR